MGHFGVRLRRILTQSHQPLPRQQVEYGRFPILLLPQFRQRGAAARVLRAVAQLRQTQEDVAGDGLLFRHQAGINGVGRLGNRPCTSPAAS